MPAINTIQYRRGDSASWTSANPVLAYGEVGFAVDTNEIRVGDGTNAWLDLVPIGGQATEAAAEALAVANATAATVDTGRLSPNSMALKADISAVQAGYTPLDPTKLSWPKAPIAVWDFSETSGTSLFSKVGGRFEAKLFTGGVFQKSSTEFGPFGAALQLNGSTGYYVDPSQIGALALDRYTDSVTIIAWVKDTGSNIAFRAGCHTEGSVSARQYGLYFDAGFYGGDRRLSPHIGAQDGATPEYPFNKDYAATARQYNVSGHASEWHMEAMTYDGSQIIAYLDGLSDSFIHFDEPAPSPGYSKQLTNQTKNPYTLDKGINRTNRNRYFTIGASGNLNSSGALNSLFNFTTGFLGGVAVFSSALTADEIMSIRLQTINSYSEPIFKLDAQNDIGGSLAPYVLGYQALMNASSVVDTTETVIPGSWHIESNATAPDYFSRSASTEPSIIYFPTKGLRLSQVKRFECRVNQPLAATPSRLAIKTGGSWYASEATISAAVDNLDATNWSNSEVVSRVVSMDAEQWRALTVNTAAPSNVTVVNLITNPSLETGSTGWSGTNYGSGGAGVNARITENPVFGAYSQRKRWTTAPTSPAGINMQTESVPVTAGQKYRGSIHFMMTVSNPFRIRIIWRDSGGASISNTLSEAVQCAPMQVTRISVSGTAPAGAVTAYLELLITSSAGTLTPVTTSDYLWADAAMFTLGDTLWPYFDGSTSGGAWSGTAHASTSSKTFVVDSSTIALGASPLTSRLPNGPLEAVGLFSPSEAAYSAITDLAFYGRAA